MSVVPANVRESLTAVLSRMSSVNPAHRRHDESTDESTLTLEAVAAHFEQWRSRKTKGEPIPETALARGH